MAAQASVITVFVTNLSKVRKSLTVDPEITTKDLKHLVRQKMDVPETFHLGYKDQKLAVKQTLAHEGVLNTAEIWMAPIILRAIQLSGYDQARNRVNSGVQQRGSVKHAIRAVGTEIRAVGTELQRTMNTRADGITNQIETGTKDVVDKIDARTDAIEDEIAKSRTVTKAIHNILQGGETIRAPGQTTLERTKQVKIQKTALENERMSLAKEKADEKHVTMEARAKEQDARNKARIEDMATAEGAAQTMYNDLTDEELEKNRKATVKAYATEKKRRLEAAEGPPAPKKPRKNSKAAKQAALDAVAEPTAADQPVAESVDTDQPHAAASASHEGDDTR